MEAVLALACQPPRAGLLPADAENLLQEAYPQHSPAPLLLFLEAAQLSALQMAIITL